MALFDLPSELLQLILLHCSTPSFVHFIQTCRLMRDVACQSRPLLLHHLRGIPGSLLNLEPQTESVERLFTSLRASAADSLQGKSITSDTCILHFEDDSLDVKASSFDHYRRAQAALVKRESSVLLLYKFFQDMPILCGRLDLHVPRTAHLRILLSTFDELGNLYVVHSVETNAATQISDRLGQYEFSLTMIEFTKDGNPFFTQDITGLCEILFTGWTGSSILKATPVSMSAYGGNTIAIAWDKGMDLKGASQVSVMGISLSQSTLEWEYSETFYPDYFSENRASCLQSYQYSVHSISFLRTYPFIRFYSSTSALPTFCVSGRAADDNRVTLMNRIPVNCAGRTEVFQPEEPFVVFHAPVLHLSREQGPETDSLCEQTQLLLATKETRPGGPRPAYILRLNSLTRVVECEHSEEAFDMPHDPRQWSKLNVVARLWGFQLPNIRSRPAISYAKDGTRVSISQWDKVLVWPLLPEVLAKENLLKSAYEKTRDEGLEMEVVEIKPIVLNADNVVHKLLFIDPNRLMAMTGAGLLIWDLGSNGTARRVKFPLPQS